jgi:hypothetical protein
MMAQKQPGRKPKTVPSKTTGQTPLDDLGSKLLTKGQARALIAWHRLFERLGREPSVREVAGELSMTANGAHALLTACDHAGAFSRDPVEIPGPRKLTAYGKKWLTLA